MAKSRAVKEAMRGSSIKKPKPLPKEGQEPPTLPLGKRG